MKTKAMCSLKILLLAALLAQPLLAGAKSSVTVTTPKRNASITNGVLTATGKVKSTLPVTGVYYSFNGGDWLLASGTTNWSAPDLALTPGPNSLWAYAVDSGAVPSPTNKVTFTYVVMAPVTVLTNGPGMINPNYNNKLLQLGKSYVMNAKANKGFAFSGWTGDLTNASAHLTFIMQSNLTLIANFVDATPPKLTITAPTANQSISNSPITATCRATDNVGITAVYYRLNGGSWNADATSLDNTNWNCANLALTPGANTLQAYALDAAGKVSLTNTVTFNYVSNAPPPVAGFAPASLNGWVGHVVGAMDDNGVESPFDISFGLNTFAISSTDTNEDFAAGSYAYTLLDSNTVRLSTLTVLPRTQAGDRWTHIFVFTNSNTCVFTNDLDQSLGRITFAAAPNRVPSASAILTLDHWETGGGNLGTTVLNKGVFTNYTDYGQATQSAIAWGNYSLEPFSPIAAVLEMHYSNIGDAGRSDQTLLTLTSATNGAWFADSFDTNTNLDWMGTGEFQVTQSANPPSGNAPMSLSGKLISVSQGGMAFKICFGDNAYTIFDSDTNDNNTVVQVYTYIKTGPNTATLYDYTVLPPDYWNLTSQNVVNLTFNSSTSGTAQSDGQPSNFSISMANNYAPLTMAGKTITSREGGKLLGSGTFNHDGTFTFTMTDNSSETMIYDYMPCSPVGGMILMTHPDGRSSYVQLQFSNTSSGSWYETDYDPYGYFESVETGTFTVN